jgi:peptidoglycan/xylan/chitin deacetylase (PgdA/CDA1 family)
MVDAMSKTRMQMVLAWAVMVAGMTLSQAATTRDEAEKPKDPYGIIRRPIPEKLVVLTFDDACLSHAKVVGPLLTKYGCGGTFFVSDAFGFSTRKDWYMTWEQIKGVAWT